MRAPDAQRRRGLRVFAAGERSAGAGLFIALLLGSSIASALDWPGRIEAVEDAYARRGDAESRIAALQRLGDLDAATAAPLLELALRDHLPEVRAAAAEVAGDIRAFEVRDPLIERLSDRVPAVRATAASALGRMRVRDAVGPVGRLLSDSDAGVREAAVTALGEMGSAEAVVAIVGVLGDRSREVVVAALGALGRLGQPGTVYAILERAHDPVEQVALATVDALIALGVDEAHPALVELAQSGRPSAALAAIEGLGELRVREAVPALVSEALSPRIDGGGEAAVSALVAIDDATAIEPLLPLLLSEPDSVAPYYVSMEERAWPLLASTFGRLAGPDGVRARRVLDVWLASGDPRALDAAEGLVALAPSELGATVDLLALYRRSPTATALCRAAGLVPRPVAVDAMADWAGWAAASGSLECFAPLVADLEVASAFEVLPVVDALGAAAPALAVEVVDRFVDVGRLDWEAGVRLVALLGRSGEVGRPALTRMLASADRRLRREAAFALAELEPGPDIAAFWAGVGPGGARADRLRALEPYLGTGAASRVHALVSELFAAGSPAEQIEALELARHTCQALDERELVRALGASGYWLRRKAYAYAFACGPAAAQAALDEAPRVPDPVVRAMAMANAPPDSLADIAADTGRADVERVAALRTMIQVAPELARAVADPLRRDQASAVAAAAWLVTGSGGDQTGALIAALASDQPLERAAIYASLLRDHPTADLDHARRREQDRMVLRVLDGAPPFAGGATVFLVDADSGVPRRDESVFAIFDDGDFELRRTDVEGRVAWRRDDVIGVIRAASDP